MKIKRRADIVIETTQEELDDFVELLGAIHENLMKKYMRVKDDVAKAQLSDLAAKAKRYQRQLSGQREFLE